MPKALSHTVVFTDDIDEAIRLCTDVANLSPNLCAECCAVK